MGKSMKVTKLASKEVKQTGITLLTLARKEKTSQKWLEQAQLAIAKGEIALSNAVEAAKKELERVAKVRVELKKFKINPLSDYKTLKAMYDNNLSLITEDNLVNDYSSEAKKKIERFVETNDQQKEVIAQFYNLKARREFAVISQVKAFLTLVGEIKEDVKEVPKAKKELVEAQ
jgi:hypothetical protein